jgi:hypothetical protein
LYLESANGRVVIIMVVMMTYFFSHFQCQETHYRKGNKPLHYL